jgi:hypothetical protein
MAAISTLRGTLATDLANAGVWSTFAVFHLQPAWLIAVVVTPSDPYIVPTIIHRLLLHPWLILRF